MFSIKRVFPLMGASILLFSCNKNMPKVYDYDAISIAEAIYKRQQDSVFNKPTIFSYSSEVFYNTETKTPNNGYIKSNQTGQSIYSFDIDNLKYRTYTKTTNNENYEYSEIIHFYDNQRGIFYDLIDKNGYKTRTEHNISYADAKIRILNSGDYINTMSNVLNSYFLSNFKNMVINYQQMHKQLEVESDQYFNYSFGSNDAKSLETIVDLKNKINTTVDGVTMNGYDEAHGVTAMEKDLFKNQFQSIKDEYKSFDGKFYKKENGEQKSNYSNNATINIPNVGDYIKQ